MNHMENHTFSAGLVIGILCAALVAGIVINISKNRKAKKTLPKPEYTKGCDIKKEGPKSNSLVEDLPPKQYISALSPSLIEPHMKKFASSIGALWQISKQGNENDMGKLTFDNLDLIIQSIPSEDLKKEWKFYTNDRNSWSDELYKDKAANLISLFKSLGVEILPEQEIEWDNDSHKRYRKYLKIEIGDKCEVLSPCAMYKGAIIEQGIVRKL